MAANFQGEDCFYFLYSTCTKGASCPFRHQELCKKNESVCKEWESTRNCSDPYCSNRHSLYHLDKKRSEISCYWEMNGGCKKEHCPFKHSNLQRSVGKPDNQIQPTVETKQLKNLANEQRNTIGKSLDSFQSKVPPKKLNDTQHSTTGEYSTIQTSNKRITLTENQSIRTRGDVESKINSITNNITGSKRFKDTKKGQAVDFEVKSLDQIMKEKKIKQEEASSPSTSNKSNNNLTLGKEKTNQIVSAASEKSNIKSSTPSGTKSTSSAKPLLNDSSSTESLLEYLDKELEEMNQLLG